MPDVLETGLRAVFCGINPGHVSAAAGAHFANPRNDFWRLLHDAGFTEQLMSPFDERELLALGYGVTNVVGRATAAADALTREEIIDGGRRLTRKVRRYRPGIC